MISQFYKLALAALLGLSLAACGGGSSEPQHEATAPVRSLHTGRVLLVGGNALIDYDPITRTISPRYFGPCVDNEGRFNGDSTTTLGVFQLGVLNAYPSRVVIVADEFELTHADRHLALDNYTGAIVHSVASGARTTIVGVPSDPAFNSSLRGLALAYGAEYAETLSVSCD